MDSLPWYGVLITSVQPKGAPLIQSLRKNASTKPFKSKTLIVATWAPLPLINEMNALKEENIQLSASKAFELVVKHTAYIDDIAYHIKRYETQPRYFDIVCIFGPIEGQEKAAKLITSWEKRSRGPQPRTITAYRIAQQGGYTLAVNLYKFLQIDPTEAIIQRIPIEADASLKVRIWPFKNPPLYSIDDLKLPAPEKPLSLLLSRFRDKVGKSRRRKRKYSHHRRYQKK
jgi:hypothetical protein